MREILELHHTDDYRYVFLAQHAKDGASRYLDPARFRLFTVTMPVVLAPPRERAANAYAKFAVYGNADQLVLHNVAQALAQRRPRAPYELKVISSKRFGVQGFANVQVVGKRGTLLSRAEMEAEAEDVDFFLFLSDRHRYRFSCSGMVFEAFSLVKPLVYFSNECVDQFSTTDAPIGIRCETFDAYIDALVDLIEQFPQRGPLRSQLRDGVLRRREALQREDVVGAVRTSFEW